MKTPKIFLLISSILFLFSCSISDPKKSIERQTAAILPPGYQCMLIPDGFFTPGYLYEVGEDGVSYALSFANKEIKAPEVDAGFPSIVLKNNSSSDIGAAYAGIGSAQLQYTNTDNTSFYFSDVKHSSIDISAETAALRWLNSHATMITPGNKIFIIRDSYLAGHVKYNISKLNINKLGGEAKFKQNLISLNGKIYESSNNSDYALEREFTPRVPVCFKAREVLYSTGLNGTPRYERMVASKIPENLRSIRKK